MAFSGSGFGSGGFGSTNTNNTGGSLFGGGFGSNNNNNNTGGFGSQPTGGFGSTAANTGSTFGGFGSTNNNNTFGAAKSAFGTAPANTGGLFGNNNNAQTGGFGGGGFGSTANNSTSAFGSTGTTGGGLFGNAAKPASTFGSTTGGSLFGGSTFGGSTAVGSTTSTGFGGATAPIGECQGTAQPAYSVTQEKEQNTNVMNNFQSITHIPAYQKWSFEELRVADYNAGRRFANASGQAGGFGVGTNFGGFSNNNNNQTQGSLFGSTNNNAANTGTSLFGNNSTANTGFGSNTQTNTGFGGFGSKPATTGSLFGSTNNNAAQNSGSLFGGTGGFGSNAGTGFGSNTTTNTGFGATNTDNKPSLFNTPNTGGGLFGNNNAASNTSGGLFGATNQNQSTGFGNNQSGTTNNLFGSTANTGGGLFGNNNNAAKPGGLFGSTPAANTGGSLFGGAQQNNQQSGGLFGNTTTNNNSNSLFAPKPATTTLFGAQPQQQNQGSSLFGNTQQNQPAQGGLGLFGNTQQKPANSLFGNSTTQNAIGGSSLFGNAQPQQSQSLFGNSLNANQASTLQPPQPMTASIFDNRPYGSVSIFDGLPPPPVQNVGPIATPISSGQKQRKPAVLPQWKLNPTMSPRFVTPQKQGYGFSYSRYGTPSSISSVASTPGHFGGSLMGSTIGRTLGKSVSVSNLRRTYDADAESVLAPGAFTTASRLNNSHGLKKLNIDRSLRNDLFAPVTQGSTNGDKDSRNSSALKKKVSFEASSLNANGATDDEIPQITNTESSPTPSAEEQGYLRSSVRTNIFNGQSGKGKRSQETSPVKGNELAIVPEDGSPEAPRQSAATRPASASRPGDPEPGEYWLRPTLDEIKKLTPDQLRKVPNFVVGRQNVGHCAFQEPVDLSGINWNNFFDVIVQFGMRSICVYPESSKKPPVGMGINVPSTITLENCWPRSRSVRSGPRLEKHIKHLQTVTDCEFVRYNVDNGEWTFKVPHFTTYGLDYEDEEDMDFDAPNFKSSVLSDAFSEITPTFLQTAAKGSDAVSSALTDNFRHADNSVDRSVPENMFGDKKSKHIPGGFDTMSDSGNDDSDVEMQQVNNNELAFLGERSVSPDSEDEDEPSELSQGESQDEQSLAIQDTDADLNMAGAFPEEPANMPKSILKQSTYDDEEFSQPEMFLEDDWAEQLQRTISPRKRDRQNLRASQAVLFHDLGPNHVGSPTKKSKNDMAAFESSIDIMNSIFGKEDHRRTMMEGDKSDSRKEFQWPYNKNIDREPSQLDQNEQAFHESFKPHWGPGNVLVHAVSQDATHADAQGARMQVSDYLASEGYNVCLSKFSPSTDLVEEVYERQLQRSDITVEDGIPFAKPAKLMLRIQDTSSIPSEEALIWNLAGILFDEYDDAISEAVPAEQRQNYYARIQKDRLSTFWRVVCENEALDAVEESKTTEERAIHFLTMGAITEACTTLAKGKDFRLATLISQIGGDLIIHHDITQQIKEWRRLNVLSEMTDAIRTLYEMLAGNVCVCEGRQGPTEDRAATFTVSEKYNLSWTRAFGLRLWYAIGSGEPIEAAVKKYLSDLAGPETARPKPRFLERDNGQPSQPDPNLEQREDILWGLLRLFADQKTDKTTIALSDVLAPENISHNFTKTRLSWELYFALSPYLSQQHSSDAADKLTISFAAELISANKWAWAIFVLLHLRSPEQRESAVRDVLTRHAATIDIDSLTTLQILFGQLQIPSAWVYEAKALYARSVQHDRLAELHYLQRAGNWDEAHNVLCATVAPQAIIERDHEMLSRVLAEFEQGTKPHNWRIGGCVYNDYLALLSTNDHSERIKLLKRLARSLPEMAKSGHPGNKKRKGATEKGSRSEGFLRSVAVKEMGWTVGNLMVENSELAKEHELTFHLPLNDEKRRDRSRDLAMEYYQRIMASG